MVELYRQFIGLWSIKEHNINTISITEWNVNVGPSLLLEYSTISSLLLELIPVNFLIITNENIEITVRATNQVLPKLYQS